MTLVRGPQAAPTGSPSVTASGSVAVAGAPARVARAGRLWVEGIHDAELVEKVWGDDLRIEGVVVERLDGIDHLARAVADFRPGPARRLGVLVDHLVAGSKESRLAEAVRHPDVLVTGTPFVDVWQAVRPSVLGIGAWPRIPRGRRVEGRRLRRARPRRPAGRLATDPGVGLDLRRPRARAGRLGRAAHRLRHLDRLSAAPGGVHRPLPAGPAWDQWRSGKGLCPLGGHFPYPYSRKWVPRTTGAEYRRGDET